MSPPERWVLTMSDEFDGAEGTPPNPAMWTYDVGGDGWGNGQLEFNTDRVENVSLDGQGNLRIVALEESYMGNEYTSARIKTQGLFEQKYGRFEARIKLPEGQGLWPAFWMLGANVDEVPWPGCGEIDVMEYQGNGRSGYSAASTGRATPAANRSRATSTARWARPSPTTSMSLPWSGIRAASGSPSTARSIIASSSSTVPGRVGLRSRVLRDPESRGRGYPGRSGGPGYGLPR